LNPRSFFAELKRRNVYKVAAAYLVVSWLLIQAASILFPTFDAPASAMKTLVVFLAIGFPIALAFSWAFEITPEGVVRESDIETGKSIAHHTGRKIVGLTAVLAVIAAGLLAFQLWGSKRSTIAPGETASAVRAQATATIPDKSIAVLPLTNEGGAKDEQYFSDGLSEDLITALSQFAGLKVIGRNSSFQFRDSKDDSKTIGAKLGVAHLLEGSVRRAADAVRISAELINAADGTTLWSQHYDRPYKDLFQLQDDITTAVANALKAKLLNTNDAAAQSDRPPSGNLAAYNAYLQGNFYAQRNTEADYRKAIDFYETAVSLDPQYAWVYAALGRAQIFLGDYFHGAQAQQIFSAARSSINTALKLDPDSGAAHGARALLLAFADLDFPGAKAEFERAVQLAPTDLNLRASLCQMQAAFGNPEGAVEPIKQTLAIDPRNAGWYGLLAIDLMAVGRLDEAEQAYKDQSTLEPTEAAPKARLSSVEVVRGNAAAALERAKQVPPGELRDFALANARQIGNDKAAADAALKSLIDQYGQSDAYLIARVYALRKDPDKVFEWLDRAWANRDNNVCIVYYDPFILPYKNDPRFAAFCQKIGLPTPAELAASPKA
jgi:TolB-like protein/cytochrome c-type biogenesis protein CcmH/NrfG